ncbi:MAG: hypothetical protein ABS977_15585 [Pseudomonas qingdaonensis]|uniref:hypothetical protein n=1 Tax=Pseudomonas TaxID=286 RepID=UPI0011B0401B|nr:MULTISPECIES: hypothetical protein [Pseudomonas]WKL66637.1 hypothetical protein Q1Z72_25695 [Pseudomonas qingdaonensis]
MDGKCSFLVGDAVCTPLDVLQDSQYLKLWFESIGSRIDRFGGARGKVIKYTSSSFERNIRLMDSVELFSERLWAKGEQDEPFNCAFSAVLSSATGLLLAANSEQVDVTDLLEFVLLYEFFYAKFGYIYLYRESQVYGAAYGMGYYSPDECHPMFWSRRSEAGKWAKAKRMSLDYLYLRDVFDLNCLGQSKIKAFPEVQRKVLEDVVGRYGEVEERNGFVCWALSGDAQEAARDELIYHGLLASHAID